MTDIFSLIDRYNNFSEFAIDILKFLSGSQAVLISLVGILILYFGYHSNIHKPIKTQKLQLYFSGLGFISTYLVVQMIVVYFISKNIPLLNLVYWLLLIILFIAIFFILDKIRLGKKTMIFKILILILFFYFVPSTLWNYISLSEDIKWIVFFLSLYHATMVITSCFAKEIINQNSYDYKEFYFKTSRMALYQYSIFSYLLRSAQEIWFDVFFGKIAENHEEKQVESDSKSLMPNKELDNNDLFDKIFDIAKKLIPMRQWKFIGMTYQSIMLQTETWFNSLILLIFMYIIFSYNEISATWGLLMFIYIFFALTSIAIEYSIYNNGFLLVEVFLKNGESFKCRLMEMNKELVTILLKGEIVKRDFNPVEYYPIKEISKIRNVSMGEMLDDF